MSVRRSPTAAGNSIFIGTVSPEGVPAGCRAMAMTSPDALKTVTVYVPLATSGQVIANLAVTRRAAVVASYPPDHSTTQLKGTAAEVRLASDEEAALVKDRLESFADVLHDFGLPRRITRRINCWPAFAIVLQVEEMYEQTPGPNAGNPL